ncbi:LIM domain-binding protein 3-like [Homalodisca vitripennis]|uniref:LIM domain-binding protein 3-like n=1 Tax=Homalodisca vitripennis TaxID=197043 RepID=UPI001EEA0E20|nr:LIM domain-binding protein 3-like [Homalodisca vitripennis]
MKCLIVLALAAVAQANPLYQVDTSAVLSYAAPFVAADSALRTFATAPFVDFFNRAFYTQAAAPAYTSAVSTAYAPAAIAAYAPASVAAYAPAAVPAYHALAPAAVPAYAPAYSPAYAPAYTPAVATALAI